MDRHDVVVVGGSIAGASLATVLARRGYDVLVLERQSVFQDQATGGYLAPWGVREATDLGLLDLLLGEPSAQVITRLAICDGELGWADAERSAVDLTTLLPATPGALGIGHPETADTLLRASTAAGAAVLRGVHDVVVTPGRQPTVGFRLYGRPHEREARLVVGADGRASPVRQQLGLRLEGTQRDAYLAGLRVDGVDGWPAGIGVMGVDGDTRFLIYPQAGGRMRLFAAHERTAYGRFAGAAGLGRFLAAFRRSWLPDGGAQLATAAPAGPCLTVPLNESWVERPYGDGVVLIGDAAGWSDPSISQGVAVALRDVAMLVGILGERDDWSDLARDGLGSYAEERGERMRRLRVASTVTGLVYGFGPVGDARRQRLRGLMRAGLDAGMAQPVDPRFACAATLMGPWRMPADTFEPEAVAAVEALLGP